MIRNRATRRAALWISAIGLLACAPAPGAASEAAASAGAALYASACSSCHGARGTGMPQHQVGFDLPLPDFTDCSFASREPDSDWIAVTHDGGPARGFSTLMPAFGGALGLGELEAVMGYVRGFCGNPDWPAGELNLPKSLVTEKAYPEDEAVYTAAVDLEGERAVSNKIVYEKRFGARNQVEIAIPFGWRESGESGGAAASSGGWLGGIGDVAVGVKRAVYHNAGTGTIFSLTGEIVLPTGDREKGLGKGTAVFEPFATFGQALPSEFFLQSQAGFELPADPDRAGREGFWRVSLGRTFTSGMFGRSWSPIGELLGAKELGEDGPVEWDAVPQMQVSLNRRQHILLSAGVRLPVTDAGTRDAQLLFYLLWDWFDGGFFSGW